MTDADDVITAAKRVTDWCKHDPATNTYLVEADIMAALRVALLKIEGPAPARTLASSANRFEDGRGANWRDSLDAQGRPTHGPERADPGCDYCDGALVKDLDTVSVALALEVGDCPWCASRFPDAPAPEHTRGRKAPE